MRFDSKPVLTSLMMLAGLFVSARASAQHVEGAVVGTAEPPIATAVEPAVAAAPEPPPADLEPAPFKSTLFFGAQGGVGFAAVKHPELGTPRVYGAMLSFMLGYNISPRVSVGLEFTNLEDVVKRDTAGVRFGSASQWLHTQEKCDNCRPSLPGGPILSYNMLLDTVAARIDVAPFGQNGLYFGGSGGLAVVSLLDPRFGVGGSARAGLRYTFAEILTIGAEGGVQGQLFQGGTAAIAFGQAVLRLAMVLPRTKSAPAKPALQGLPAAKAH